MDESKTIPEDKAKKPTEAELRSAWAALREWQGPWDPVNTGDMAGRIKGIDLTVKVKRWIEDDGTTMAAAMADGIELERKVVGETLPN